MLSGLLEKGAEWLATRMDIDSSEELIEKYEKKKHFDRATSNTVILVEEKEADEDHEEGDEYVLKILEGFTGSQFLELASGILYEGKIDYPNIYQCLENETELNGEIGKYLELPDVLERKGKAFVQDKIDSIPYKEWAEEADLSNFRSVTRTVFGDYSELLDEGYSLRDARLSNLGVKRNGDGDYCWFDLEYAEAEAGPEAQRIDKLQMLESAKHLDPEMYREFRQIFEEFIGEVNEEIELASDLASIGHSFPYSLSDIEEMAESPTRKITLPESLERKRNEGLGYEPNEKWYRNALENAEYFDEDAGVVVETIDDTLEGYLERA